jgi:hypothetical protein
MDLDRLIPIPSPIQDIPAVVDLTCLPLAGAGCQEMDPGMETLLTYQILELPDPEGFSILLPVQVRYGLFSPHQQQDSQVLWTIRIQYRTHL